MALYLLNNAAMQTTAAPVAVTTGTAIKTLLQVKPAASGSGQQLKIKEWGISFDGSAAGTPIKVELIETDVAATVTAAVAADITKMHPSSGNSTVSLGTAATGYTASAEGTITATRDLDGAKFVAPTNQYEKIFPLGDEPVVDYAKFLRIRVTAPVAVNAYCYIKFEE